MISGSPIFLVCKLSSDSCTISSNAPFLTASSSSILARHSVVCCPHNLGIPKKQPYLSKCSVSSTTFSHVYHWPTHPLIGLLVPDACFFLMHSTDYQHTGSRIASPKHYCLPDASHNVSSLRLLASRARIHRCGQACRQQLLESTSYSTWLHLPSDFAPDTLLQMAQLLKCSPCPEENDKAFSRCFSLGNDLQPMHSVVPSSPSQHMIGSYFCIVLHLDGFSKCSKLSLNRQVCSFSTSQAPF